jgi:hypothetical protein
VENRKSELVIVEIQNTRRLTTSSGCFMARQRWSWSISPKDSRIPKSKKCTP